MKKFVGILLVLFGIAAGSFPVSAQTVAPEKERRVYLWDVSGSLRSNGMWQPLKDALRSSIERLEDNPNNLIIVIPFYDMPLDEFCAFSDKKGKEEILDIIDKYEYPKLPDERQRTDLINALIKFEESVKIDVSEYVNYMFFYTDGGHEDRKSVV